MELLIVILAAVAALLVIDLAIARVRSGTRPVNEDPTLDVQNHVGDR